MIRSMCPVALNAIMGANDEFIAMTCNDPLVLLNILKRIVTTKCDGHVEHDRTDALTEWYNLRMGDTEDISRALDKVALAACITDPEGVEQRKCRKS